MVRVEAGSGFRQRRALERRAKRRARNLRLAVAAAVVLLLVIGLAWAGLGSGGTGGEAGEPESPPEAGTTLLGVTDSADLQAVVLLGTDQAPPLMLALPANTLVQGAQGFEALGVLLEQGYDQAEAGLESLLGLRPTAYAEMEWSELRKAAAALDADTTWPEHLTSQPGDAAMVLLTVELLAKDQEHAEKARDLEMTGDDVAARAALTSLAGRVEAAQVVPGKLVEGVGFVYFEPDLPALRALLGQAGQGRKVEVEVQNGSGAVGVTEAVAEAIKPLGYGLLPARNADQFPDVEATQIFAAPDVLAEGERVQEAIGLGHLLPREELPPGRIVVVVGKDLTVEKIPPTTGAGSSSPDQPTSTTG